MKKFRQLLSVPAVLAFVVPIVFTCRVVEEDDDPTAPAALTDLCLSQDDITGWTPWANDCVEWSPNDLLSVNETAGGVNGGAEFWIDEGMVKYIYQEVAGPSGKTLKAYVMDYENNAQSKAMFDKEKADASTFLAIDGYPETAATIAVFGGGASYDIYANIDKYYLKLTFTGMENDDDAQNMAKAILDLYSSRI